MKSIPTINATWNVLSILILGSYMFVLLLSNWHGIIDHDHQQEHGTVQEADPCHISIYHEDVSDACDHETHISEVISVCELCDTLTTTHDYILNRYYPDTLYPTEKVLRPIASERDFSALRTTIFLRGPPLS